MSGTTGESPTLTTDEKLRLYGEIKDALGESAAVIAGTGNYSTSESIELSMEAQKQGVDGLLLVVPYYNKPPQEGLYRHFKAIAAHVDLPCMVYNVTSRTSLNMSDATTIRLSHIDNIIGVKEAGSDMDQVTRIIDGAKPGFKVWSGNDNETFYIMATGGYGVVSVASHLVGSQIKQMMGLPPRRGRGRRGHRAPPAPCPVQSAVHRVQPHSGQILAEPGWLQRRRAEAAPDSAGRFLRSPDPGRSCQLRDRLARAGLVPHTRPRRF